LYPNLLGALLDKGTHKYLPNVTTFLKPKSWIKEYLTSTGTFFENIMLLFSLEICNPEKVQNLSKIS